MVCVRMFLDGVMKMSLHISYYGKEAHNVRQTALHPCQAFCILNRVFV